MSEPPNFRTVAFDVCCDCCHLRHDQDVIPNHAFYCNKHDFTLSNYMKDFSVCDDWELYEDE